MAVVAPPAEGAGGAGSGSDPDRRPRRSNSALITLFVVFFAVLGVGAVARIGVGSALEDGWYGTYLPEPLDRPDFTLTTTEGEPFDFRAETEGKLTFLFFGYANCPDICPITLATLRSALDAAPGLAATVVFVSVDPERDRPDDLRAYLDRFDRSFVGLTGTPAELDAAQSASGTSAAQLEEPDETGAYDVGHSSRVLVITPDDRAHLSYAFGVRQDEWADDLRRLRGVDEWWSR
ncbi:MAG: SCO family protein [Acidimicrobiia bacterium]|nr:SCO family protein [Acidimicrobiia bacterium]